MIAAAHLRRGDRVPVEDTYLLVTNAEPRNEYDDPQRTRTFVEFAYAYGNGVDVNLSASFMPSDEAGFDSSEGYCYRVWDNGRLIEATRPT